MSITIVPRLTLLQTEYVSAPAAEPVTAAEVKAFLELDAVAADRDDLIEMLVAAQRRRLEAERGVAMISQTLRQTWRGQGPALPLRYPLRTASPISSVELISGGESESQTVADYFADASRPPLLRLSDTGCVHASDGQIRVTYLAGFGTEGSDVPEELLQALLIRVAEAFSFRLPQEVGHSVSKLYDVDELLFDWPRVRQQGVTYR